MGTPISDRNRAELHEILSHLGRPSYVKEAAAVDFGETDRIPSSSFADPETRQFPCHTKEACWVSAAFLAHSGTTGEPIKRLEKFAKDWGITSDTQVIFAKEEIRKEMQKTAAAAVPYALDEQYGGERIKRFPVATKEMVKLSADRLFTDRAKYPYEWRAKAASCLIEKIAAFGIEDWIDTDTRDYLDRAAGRGTLDKSAMWHELATAQHYMAKHDGIEKLAAVVEALDKLDDAKFTKTACAAFATFHESAGLNRYVDYLPEEKLVGTTMTKIAEDKKAFVKLADGSTINVDEIGIEKIAAVLPELAKCSRRELREALAALPSGVAETLRLAAC